MAKTKSEAERGESIISSETQKTATGEIDTLTVAPRGETVVDIGDDDGAGVQVADKVSPRESEPPPADGEDDAPEGNRNILDDVGQKKKAKPFNKTRDGRIAELTRDKHRSESEKAALLAELEELRGGMSAVEREKKKSDYAAVQHYADNIALKRKEAQREHKEALDAGDTEKASAAAALMAELAAKAAQVEDWKARNSDPTAEPDADAKPNAPKAPVRQAAPPPPPETAAWLAANPWFDQSKPEYDQGRREEAQAFAQLLEARLRRVGNAQAIGSREYFDLIDRHMQETFGGAEDEGEEEAPPARPAPPRMSQGSGVAPVRSNATGRAAEDAPPSNPNLVRLTEEQKEIAHALILKHPNGQSYSTREKEVAYARGLRVNNRKGA